MAKFPFLFQLAGLDLLKLSDSNFDELVKSARLVIPDLIRNLQHIGMTEFRHALE